MRSPGVPLLISVETYPPADIDRRSPEVAAFRAAAAARVVPGMNFSTGPDEVAPGMVAPLVGFTFHEQHLPQPFNEILDWLRQHELVRVIEIERTILAGDVKSYDAGMTADPTRLRKHLKFIPGEYEDVISVSLPPGSPRLLVRMLPAVTWAVLRFRRAARRLSRMASRIRHR